MSDAYIMKAADLAPGTSAAFRAGFKRWQTQTARAERGVPQATGGNVCQIIEDVAVDPQEAHDRPLPRVFPEQVLARKGPPVLPPGTTVPFDSEQDVDTLGWETVPSRDGVAVWRYTAADGATGEIRIKIPAPDCSPQYRQEIEAAREKLRAGLLRQVPEYRPVWRELSAAATEDSPAPVRQRRQRRARPDLNEAQDRESDLAESLRQAGETIERQAQEIADLRASLAQAEQEAARYQALALAGRDLVTQARADAKEAQEQADRLRSIDVTTGLLLCERERQLAEAIEARRTVERQRDAALAERDNALSAADTDAADAAAARAEAARLRQQIAGFLALRSQTTEDTQIVTWPAGPSLVARLLRSQERA